MKKVIAAVLAIALVGGVAFGAHQIMEPAQQMADPGRGV